MNYRIFCLLSLAKRPLIVIAVVDHGVHLRKDFRGDPPALLVEIGEVHLAVCVPPDKVVAQIGELLPYALCVRLRLGILDKSLRQLGDVLLVDARFLRDLRLTLPVLHLFLESPDLCPQLRIALLSPRRLRRRVVRRNVPLGVADIRVVAVEPL